jgi:aspartate 1-decarboxylase
MSTPQGAAGTVHASTYTPLNDPLPSSSPGRLNGAAAHLIKKGEQVIIIGFELVDAPIEPTDILVDESNRFIRYLQRPD